MAVSNLITNIAPAIGAGAVATVRPPVRQGYLVTDFASDQVFVTGVPDLQVQLTNGIGGSTGIILIDPTTDPGKRTRQLRLYIMHYLWMLIKNTSGFAANIGYFGEKVNVNNIRSGKRTIGATSYEIIQPPVGETWCIAEWGATPFTVAGDDNPACEVGLTDGILIASRITRPTEARAQDKQPNIIINNDVYLNIYSTPGCEFYFSAIRIPETSISSVTDVDGTGGTPWVDIRPAADDEEWVITEIGTEALAGAGVPADLPDVRVSLMVGADLSNVMEDGALLSARWNTDAILKIDHNHFLRITDNSGGFNEVCVSGFIQRSY